MSRSTLRLSIIVLTTITAIIHLALGIGGVASGNGGTLDILFILNAIGYFALMAALFARNVPFFASNRVPAHYLMIAYAALTMVLYFVVNGDVLSSPQNVGPAAIVAKVDEFLLITATVLHLNTST